MTFREIITGTAPFENKKNDTAVIFYVIAGNRPAIPAPFKDNADMVALMKRSWDLEPKNRPTAEEVGNVLDRNFPGPKSTGWFASFGGALSAILRWPF